MICSRTSPFFFASASRSMLSRTSDLNLLDAAFGDLEHFGELVIDIRQ